MKIKDRIIIASVMLLTLAVVLYAQDTKISPFTGRLDFVGIIGMTGLTAPSADDQLLTSDSTSAATWRTLTNCTGAGKAVTYATATNAWGCNTISGSGYDTVQDEGSGLTQRSTLNFTGAGVTCADNSGSTRTDCTIAGTDTNTQGFSAQFETSGTHSPVDSTLYYFGAPYIAVNSTASQHERVIGQTGTIIKACISIVVGGTLGDSATGSALFRINETDSTTINAATAYTAVNQSFCSGVLSVAVSAGDRMEIKVTSPNWLTTNPTVVGYTAAVYMTVP